MNEYLNKYTTKINNKQNEQLKEINQFNKRNQVKQNK